MSWLFSEAILQRKHYFKRNLGSPVKSCPKVSLIYLSESVRRRSIFIGCDKYKIKCNTSLHSTEGQVHKATLELCSMTNRNNCIIMLREKLTVCAVEYKSFPPITISPPNHFPPMIYLPLVISPHYYFPHHLSPPPVFALIYIAT